MAITRSEYDIGTSFHKGFSEWWSEEAEYVFQRIERWAAFARGYNRLRSQRLSRGRMTMQEEQEPRWRISSNKLVIDDNSWSPRFHALKRSRRKSRTEESKINCCGTFSYQSNSNLDSSCLESYRYDHSIYFKTIGDIRKSKKDHQNIDEDRISISSEELVEWDADEAAEFIADHFAGQLLKNGDTNETLESSDNVDEDPVESDAWPITDLADLQIDSNTIAESIIGYYSHEINLKNTYEDGNEEFWVINASNNNNNILDSTEILETIVSTDREQFNNNIDNQETRSGFIPVLNSCGSQADAIIKPISIHSI